jgi:TonB family protein
MKFVTIAAIAALCAVPAAIGQDKLAATPPVPATGSQKVDSKSCGPLSYPRRAFDNWQTGMVEAGFLVGADGAVEDSFLVTSSGVPDLDRATLASLRKCRFTPATADGQAVTRWMPVLYVWQLESTSAEPEFLKKLEQGRPAGQYLLALMYLKGFMVPKDEQVARRWLPVAAERGVPMAQFRLGEAYEEGSGVAQDDARAVFWYRQAAAQRTTFAREKLHFGFGSIAPVPEKEN